ncbi:unnamed protein product [Durusdinium trenchii]|uniref:DOT1 domain-containing protein n=1 Tax=Durusdinium trenchii TaxID=1381693 RepID=A0ABP0LV10_9DINO
MPWPWPWLLVGLVEQSAAEHGALCPDTRASVPPSSILEEQLWREVDNLLERTYDWRYSGAWARAGETPFVRKTNEESLLFCLTQGGPQRYFVWGYCIGLAEDQVVKDAQARVVGPNETLQAHTYGEVTSNGVRQLVQFLGLTHAGEPAAFLDLGGGVGKMVLQTYLEVPRVTRSLAVELHPTRAKRGKEALETMIRFGELQELRQKSLQSALLSSSTQASVALAQLRHQRRRDVQLLEADMFEVDVSEFTHIYLASLTWGAPMIRRVSQKLHSEARSARVVAALSRLEGLDGFVEEEFNLQTSWTTRSATGSRLFVYTRSGS